jgi:hypothetical protein
LDEIDISPISVEDLRDDASGRVITEMSELAYHAFREPPWNDNLEAPRLHFGLGVDLMRRSAKAWIAWSKPASKVVGYILGYEAFLQSDNARDRFAARKCDKSKKWSALGFHQSERALAGSGT